MKTTAWRLRIFRAVLLCTSVTYSAHAWGRYGHILINQAAQQALPPDVPAFLRTGTARDALGYFGPEPDRWGSVSEPELKIAQEPDHFLSMEWSDLIGTLPRDRYDYVRALAASQPAHPDIVLKAEEVGTQPYQTNELYQRLKSSFRQYRMLAAANEDTAPVQAEILFLAGWMGHYVADGAQPLHLTYRYNGWLGSNPHAYTAQRHIHAQFESQFASANVKAEDVAGLIHADASVLRDVFSDYLTYLRSSRSLYEQVYQFEKEGALTGAGTADSRRFVAARMAAGATELRDLIYTAWVRSAEPLPSRQP